MRTDTGLEGFGEATLGYFAPEAVPSLVDFFKTILIGQDPCNVQALTDEMYNASVWWARSGAGRSVLSGIEIGLWDLLGKILRVPVYQLLGGAVREKIPVYASGGSTLWPIEKNVEKLSFYLQQGYRAAKFSVHPYLESLAPSDVQRRAIPVPLTHAAEVEKMAEMFSLLRKEFGLDIELAIDGHEGGVPNPISVSQAFNFAEALSPFGLAFYEEPLSYTDPDGYQELCRQSKIPVAGGESLCGLDQFHAYVGRRGLHIVQPDIGFCGGIGETVRIARYGQASNVHTAIHTGGAVGPAFAAAWHIAAAQSSVRWLEMVVAPRSIQQRLLVDDLTIRDGTLGLPTAHGLGIRFTPETLDEFPFVPGSGERT